jgi:hypothetical protein
MKKDFSVRIKVNCGDTVEVIMRRLKGVFKGEDFAWDLL